MKSTNNVVYSNSVGDIGISAEWSKNAAGDLGSDSSAVITQESKDLKLVLV